MGGRGAPFVGGEAPLAAAEIAAVLVGPNAAPTMRVRRSAGGGARRAAMEAAGFDVAVVAVAEASPCC
jgi:hypothetical protein